MRCKKSEGSLLQVNYYNMIFFTVHLQFSQFPGKEITLTQNPPAAGMSLQCSRLLSDSCFSKDLVSYKLREITFTGFANSADLAFSPTC